MKIKLFFSLFLFCSVGFAKLTLNSYGVYLGDEIKIDPTIYSSSKALFSGDYVLNKDHKMAAFNKIAFSKNKNGEVDNFMHEDIAWTVSVNKDNITGCLNEGKGLNENQRCGTVSINVCKKFLNEYGSFEKMRSCAEIDDLFLRDEIALENKDVASANFMKKHSKYNDDYKINNKDAKIARSYFKVSLCEKFEESGISLREKSVEASEYDPSSAPKAKSGVKN